MVIDMIKKRYFLCIVALLLLLIFASCKKTDDKVEINERIVYEGPDYIDCYIERDIDKTLFNIYYYDKFGIKSDVTTSTETIYNYSTSQAGMTNCKVTYNSLTTNFYINVKKKEIVGVRITLLDDCNDEYIVGDKISIYSNYEVYINYNDGSRIPAPNLNWQLFDYYGNEYNIYYPFEFVGIYTLKAIYTTDDDIQYTDTRNVTVSYSKESIYTFDKILAENQINNGRYLVNNELILEDNDMYKITISGISTYIENKDENGIEISEILENSFYNSRLLLAIAGSTMCIEIKEKLTLEMISNSSDNRTPFVQTETKKTYLNFVGNEGKLSIYKLELKPDIYYLKSDNSRFYIYSYLLYKEI